MLHSSAYTFRHKDELRAALEAWVRAKDSGEGTARLVSIYGEIGRDFPNLSFLFFFWGVVVPIRRIIVFWGLYFGTPI